MSTEPAEKKSRVPLTLGYWKIRGVRHSFEMVSTYVELPTLEHQMRGGVGTKGTYNFYKHCKIKTLTYHTTV